MTYIEEDTLLVVERKKRTPILLYCVQSCNFKILHLLMRD